MSIEPSSVADRLSAIGMTGLGLILAVTPVALWVAWTETLFLAILAVALLSAALLVLLAHFTQPEAGHPRTRDGGEEAAVVLPDDFVSEVHRIFPLTYHHSLAGRARFRRAMEKLLRLARGP